MTRGLVVVPGAPLLVPALAGRADPLAALRGQCVAAVRSLGDGPLVLVGTGDSAWYDSGSGSLRGWGAPLDVAFQGGGETLPPALTLGTWLLAAAGREPVGALSVGSGAVPATVTGAAPRDVAYVVVGEGSTRRGAKAPGGSDDRAAAYDRSLADALRAGDPALRGPARETALGDELGDELGATLPRPLAAAADLLGPGPLTATVLAECAPFGVAYFVATWLPAPQAPSF